MGPVPRIENIRVTCSDGSVVRIGMARTPGDRGDGSAGVAEVYGSLPDGRDFGFTLALAKCTDAWLDRFCDAVAALPPFREFLPGMRDGDGLVIPAAPARDGDWLAGLVRKGKDAKFKDYAGLRSGRDRFSARRLPDLEAEAGRRACDEVEARLVDVDEADRPAERAKVLRWHLRGLPVAMAVKKAEVDREVAAYATAARKG